MLGVLVSSGSGASTSTTVVGASVVGSTELDPTGCPSLDATRTSFGLLTPNTSATTSADCAVQFGSNNGTATLRTYRSSPRADAMAAATTTVTPVQSSYRTLDMSMPDASNGWAANADTTNYVMQTGDGGATWTSNAAANTALGGYARAISAPTSSAIWVGRSGNPRVIVSTNSGSSWTQRTLPGTGARATAIYADDGSKAWVVGTVTPVSTDLPRIW